MRTSLTTVAPRPALRRTRAVTAVAGLALVLAACGGSDDDGAGAGGEVDAAFNEADVEFAQGMIPHHEQAVMMSEMALDAAEDPEVLALAEEIEAAQGPEIETMRGFLETWGEDVPEAMDGMDHSMGGMDMDMPGMMSAEDMDALGEADGSAFDEMWLSMMIEHHEGAVEMATTQLDEGENPQALELAEEIVEAQESEIEEMQGLLDG